MFFLHPLLPFMTQTKHSFFPSQFIFFLTFWYTYWSYTCTTTTSSLYSPLIFISSTRWYSHLYWWIQKWAKCSSCRFLWWQYFVCTPSWFLIHLLCRFLGPPLNFNFLPFTDSLSSLKALSNFKIKNPSIFQILKICHSLPLQGKSLTFSGFHNRLTSSLYWF